MTSALLTVLMTADAVGGVWSYALGLCAALADVDFILATLGPRPKPAQRAALARLANVTLAESDFPLEWMPDGQTAIAASRRWLETLAARHAVNVAHVNGYAQARLDCACPRIVVAHSDVLSWLLAVHGAAAPAEWRDYRRRVIGGLRAADRVVAPSRTVLCDLQQQYGLPLSDAMVIPNGIEVEPFVPRPKQSVIMAAGRIWDAAKNLVLLDDIAPGLDWPIEIAGATAHPAEGVAHLRNARLLGVLDPEEMRRRLGEAAIFAAPARYEPFGLGILEAAAAGCALVLGDIASLRENWDSAAVFVPADDREQWRSALRRLIADRAERERLGAAAQARAGHFTLAHCAARYRALYRELAGASAEQRVA
ncbi:MAG: glycosyltransferase family 4 protein [Alphaproteobacteria bacterium]|nr:glycosyltransferase family 4 protein [Alphaproteobacteria bacterium]